MNISNARILIVGCGTMGSGIAEVAAAAGHDVMLYDAFEDAAAKSRERIGQSLQRAVERGKSTFEEREKTLSHLHLAKTLEEAASADVVIEAIRERLDEKQQLFAQLGKLTSPETLLLTNTSMISITEIAKSTFHPERVIGCHFFNPVPRMELVEVIRGEKTSESIFEAVCALVKTWGKTPVPAPDTPGFIVNRALLMLLNEAAFLVQEGNDPKDVDEAMKLGCNFPMGPLALADLIGVDVTLDCQMALWKQLDENPKYEPCPLLQQMVQQGKLGRKSGAGFYSY